MTTDIGHGDPTLPWYFEDIVHDHDTASDAMGELAFAAESLLEALALVEADMPAVVEDWSGEARTAFDGEMLSLVEAGHQLASLLLSAAVGVEVADGEAFAESQLRGDLQEAYEAAPEAEQARMREVAP